MKTINNTLLMTLFVALLSVNMSAMASRNTVSDGWIAISPVIARASVESGIDVKLLAAMAAIESSFRPDVDNKHSSAKGVYQFTKRTWRVTLKSYGHLYGLDKNANIHDPYANAVMAAEYIKENVDVMVNKLKRTPSYDEIYLAHLVSPLRAAAIVNMAEDIVLADIYPTIADCNKPLFFTKSGNARTVAQFRKLISTKVNRALHVYGKLANIALVKYKTGQIELAKLEDDSIDSMPYDFGICPREHAADNSPISVHFIGYDVDAAFAGCPLSEKVRSSFNLMYLPPRQDETDETTY